MGNLLSKRKDYLMRLPDELLLTVLENLPLESLFTVATVCKELNKFTVNTNELWKPFIRDCIPVRCNTRASFLMFPEYRVLTHRNTGSDIPCKHIAVIGTTEFTSKLLSNIYLAPIDKKDLLKYCERQCISKYPIYTRTVLFRHKNITENLCFETDEDYQSQLHLTNYKFQSLVYLVDDKQLIKSLEDIREKIETLNEAFGARNFLARRIEYFKYIPTPSIIVAVITNKSLKKVLPQIHDLLNQFCEENNCDDYAIISTTNGNGIIDMLKKIVEASPSDEKEQVSVNMQI